jgi:hypothetical protein
VRFLFIPSLLPTGYDRLLLSLLFSAVITYASVIGFLIADIVYSRIILIAFFAHRSLYHAIIYSFLPLKVS